MCSPQSHCPSLARPASPVLTLGSWSACSKGGHWTFLDLYVPDSNTSQQISFNYHNLGGNGKYQIQYCRKNVQGVKVHNVTFRTCTSIVSDTSKELYLCPIFLVVPWNLQPSLYFYLLLQDKKSLQICPGRLAVWYCGETLEWKFWMPSLQHTRLVIMSASSANSKRLLVCSPMSLFYVIRSVMLQSSPWHLVSCAYTPVRLLLNR